MKTKAQHKADQRKRDRVILVSIGFVSIEGVIGAIRTMSPNDLKDLQKILYKQYKKINNVSSC